MRIVFMLVLIVLLSLAFVPAYAQNPPTTPEATLYAYVNALNRREYITAYTLTDQTQPLLDFVLNFRDTLHIDLFVGSQQTDGNTVRVPTVLVEHLTDGTYKTSAGCVHMSQIAADSLLVYVINGTDFRIAPTITYPDLSAISEFVNLAPCYDQGSLSSQPMPTVPHDFTTPEQTIRAYFAAINNKNFEAAYRFWLYPLPTPDPDGAPATDYRPDFASYVDGYAGTRWINVYTNGYLEMGAAAGKPYLNGFLPVVLIDEQADGSINTYYGCYVIGFDMGGNIGIVNGSLSLLTNAPVDVNTIEATLRDLDCLALEIPN